MRHPPVRLFCWTVAQPRDAALLHAHRSALNGIFGCNNFAIYSNSSIRGVPREHLVTNVINGSMDVPYGGSFSSALNSPVFFNVWRDLPLRIGDGHADWVVKLDPDTCFSAVRMRELIMEHAFRVNPQVEAVAFGTRDLPGSRWVPGPLEVLSYAGLIALTRALQQCSEFTNPADYSEDIWLMMCINGDAPGSKRLVDFYGSRGLLCWNEARPCIVRRTWEERRFAGYHPFKNVAALRGCYRSLNNSKSAPLCTNTPACLEALNRRVDGLTCREQVRSLVLMQQWAEDKACAFVGHTKPDVCGTCKCGPLKSKLARTHP
jgi:hypothetical protein